MSRFVLLYHDWSAGPRGSHYDLMLEREGVLRTWALAELPQAWSELAHGKVADGNEVQAERLADHRLHYLDYEGPVSGSRGSVRRLDRGACCCVEESVDRFVAKLSSDVVRGTIELRRDGASWRLAVASAEDTSPKR